ncbi:5-deoxy-glucuronate isomerase [Sphingomonas sp. CGMCC 1.13654]|uniref:5-deoxy-glucuronate isomerase n=1 Tax=Sphingomonas chungangi TaxID=2683589 RepID=A0A838L7K9_9SPHN|nr:5-deoxy-glucuronate isomerase [Sphingomonas chungangi]MBA2933538.1 5-deoxy-glucuronate isomerase [Sphingomonas chungangi]MVW54871.1 5-deoxy-glucuronate isomerase [Sphingomonas chungangi]
MTLLVRSRTPGDDGVSVEVTPESAGWNYVGFRLERLGAGTRRTFHEADRETCLVFVTGTGHVSAGAACFNGLGGRATPFDGAPTAVYLPSGVVCEIEAVTDIELAICTAPAETTREVRLIAPEDSLLEARGRGSNTRYVRNILSDASDISERLLVVEVITPGGHWSSYPPHKHELDSWPQETALEETYYHRLKPPGGFAVQRVYTDDRSLDVTMTVEDGDVVMVPRGYHPVGVPHGYDLYYLNVMAGPIKAWKFTNDPSHAWIIELGSCASNGPATV